MRHFKWTQIAKMGYGTIRNPGQLKPFPGKWPTRLRYTIKYAGKPDVNYFGKPSTTAVMTLLKLFRRLDWTAFSATEIDQKHIVAAAHYDNSRRVQPDNPYTKKYYPRAYPGTSFVYYHPSGKANAFLWDIALTKDTRLRNGLYYKFSIKNRKGTGSHPFYTVEALEREQPELPAQANGLPEPQLGLEAILPLRDALLQERVDRFNAYNLHAAPAAAAPAPYGLRDWVIVNGRR